MGKPKARHNRTSKKGKTFSAGKGVKTKRKGLSDRDLYLYLSSKDQERYDELEQEGSYGVDEQDRLMDKARRNEKDFDGWLKEKKPR